MIVFGATISAPVLTVERASVGVVPFVSAFLFVAVAVLSRVQARVRTRVLVSLSLPLPCLALIRAHRRANEGEKDMEAAVTEYSSV